MEVEFSVDVPLPSYPFGIQITNGAYNAGDNCGSGTVGVTSAGPNNGGNPVVVYAEASSYNSWYLFVQPTFVCLQVGNLGEISGTQQAGLGSNLKYVWNYAIVL